MFCNNISVKYLSTVTIPRLVGLVSRAREKNQDSLYAAHAQFTQYRVNEGKMQRTHTITVRPK